MADSTLSDDHHQKQDILSSSSITAPAVEEKCEAVELLEREMLNCQPCDSGVLEAPASETSPMEISIPEAFIDPKSKVSAKKPTLEDLIRTKLPAELRLQILEEYMRCWAYRIPWQRISTNFAVPVILRVPPEDMTEEEIDDHEENYTQIGWCAIPIPPSCINLADEVVDDLQLPPAGDLDWKEFLLSNILKVTRCSKKEGQMLENIFFNEMIWQFAWHEQFSNLLTGEGSTPKFPRRCLGKFRHLSLICCDALEFQDLLQQVFNGLTMENCPFRIQTLEIRGRRLATDIGNSFDAKDPAGGTEDIRRIVTKCYEMILHHPHLKICIVGPSDNQYFPTIQRQAELSSPNPPEKSAEELEAGRGFGFSVEEVLQFLKGTSELLVGLHNIEFPNTRRKRYNARYWGSHAGVHWQMILAREWKKVCAEGLGDGGYDAVYW